MARQKDCRSSSKKQSLGNRASLPGWDVRSRFNLEDTTTNCGRNISYDSETSGLYIEEEEIGNASASQGSTECEVSLTSSIDISSAAALATAVLRSQKARVPSWSDSSGSTYVSRELQISPQHSFKESLRSKSDDWSVSDSNNLDFILQSPDMKDNERERKDRMTKKLEGIPYYPSIEEALSNTDLSAIESLQKETAQSIFCKRLVPLLIPKKSRDEDISAVSIAEDPPESVFDTRFNRQERPIERLENVNYLPSIKVASNNEDISTVAYRVPYKIADQAFGRPKMNAANKSMGLPRLIVYAKSDSTLSSLESNSDLESDDESYGDGHSNEATRQAKATNTNTKSKCTQRTERVRDLEEELSAKGSDVSSSDARIRELKKKIQKLKSGSKLERERPTQRREGEISHRAEGLLLSRTERLPIQGREQRASVPYDVDDSISKKIHELTRVAKDQRRRRGGNFVDDPTGGLAHGHRRLKYFDNGQNRIDFTSQEVRISENNHSLAFGQAEFPVVIHQTRQDEVSAMHGHSDTCQVSDIETALRSALERKRKKAATKSREAREKFELAMINCLSRGKEFISSAMKESAKNEPQPSSQQTWQSCMEGRSTGEKLLIVSVSIALVVLFILLIVVLAGR
ncbi:unnamed protein product [Cylindrotheca closterium]|uniref:Uncharacterized protein n=1 Tax=Cylindrotheca closterium TaxID=2856 RepID=A0AAD2PV22_9STRA|nr:unnamed protein product [Cylindrotheca closterium]